MATVTGNNLGRRTVSEGIEFVPQLSIDEDLFFHGLILVLYVTFFFS